MAINISDLSAVPSAEEPNSTTINQIVNETAPLFFVTPLYGASILVVFAIGITACLTNLYIIASEQLEKDTPMFTVIKYQVRNDVINLLIYPYYALVVITQSILFAHPYGASFVNDIDQAAYTSTGVFQMWVALLRVAYLAKIQISTKFYKYATLVVWFSAGASNFLLRKYLFGAVNYLVPYCACYRSIPEASGQSWLEGLSMYYYVLEIATAAIPGVCYGGIIIHHILIRSKASGAINSTKKAEFNMTVTCALNASFQVANGIGWRYVYWMFNLSNQFNSMFGSILCLLLIKRINNRLRRMLGLEAKGEMAPKTKSSAARTHAND